jgi:hypothetical protein
MFDAAIDGSFMGLYVQGEDILQSDPDTKHVAAGLAAIRAMAIGLMQRLSVRPEPHCAAVAPASNRLSFHGAPPLSRLRRNCNPYPFRAH